MASPREGQSNFGKKRSDGTSIESSGEQMMDVEEEDAIVRKRRQARERKERWMKKQSQESLAKINNSQRACYRHRIEQMTPEQAEERRTYQANYKRNRIAQMTPDQVIEHRASNARYQRKRIDQMTPEQAEDHRCSHADSQRFYNSQAIQRRREAVLNEAINFVEARVDAHDCGPLNIICHFCDSKNFIDERPRDGLFTSCCRKGKIKLPKPLDVNGVEQNYPEFLRSLLSDRTDPNRAHFRDNIRQYNNSVSFASMGANIVNLPGRGPYVFKVHGQTYHKTSHIQPINNDTPFLDSTQATNVRQDHSSNQQCKRDILDRIDRFFRQNNRYSATYKMMRNIHEREAQQALRTGQRIPIVSMTFTRDRQSDKRRYNAPTSNEIAMVFVNDDGEPPFERDIRIYPVNPLNPNQPFINLHILSPNMDPMTYSILFPYGEPGWQTNWQCESYPGAQANKVRHNVSMLQYKVALTAIRDIYSPILAAGKLSQQWIVDSYLQVEANNLNYVRQNQKRLRVEQYKGLADYMANIAQNANVQAGVAIILPSSFEGSPRNMRERCCDAMSIFSKHGAPDLFVTFTANPTWTEIVSNLRDGEQTSDRPDLVARVFKIKLDALIEDLTKNGVLGQCLAFVYTIEFQKRGLPHAHILLTLRAEDKFTTSERIDQVVSAEIPPAVDSRLRKVILRCMMHGPCGAANGNAACMVDGKCSKQYPKAFQPVTKRNDNGYPEYRRVSGVQVEVRRSTMDNRNVVPYNPFISLKYNAHVNVEVVTSLKAVKYIYKYIFKGHDCTNIVITSDGQAQLNHNEITNYVDGRYVSAPEAMWRLREFHMHDRSHTVMRLPVHLLNQHTVVFQEGNEEEALALAETGKTKLTQWFELNQQNTDAHHLLYTDLPHHYVYVKGSWKKRQRGGDNIVSRMYMVNMKDEERFFLRILLLHVQGATGFEMLRTYNDETYETFKGAAAARGLLATDEEWDRCLTDGSTYKMPKQLREMFSYICCFCHPSEPLKLWEDHIDDFILDYIRFDAADVAKNKALHDIEAILKQHGMSCSSFGLPEPTGNAPSIVTYDQAVEEEEGFRRLAKLNEKQRDAFSKIISAVDNPSEINRCFFLDGPGGSGKTFLYNTLMAHIRGRGQIVLPFATTGIAATLLKGGRTVHSGFKLPVPLLDNSVSSMRLFSPEAAVLREAKLIIIDEITMLEKNGIRVIDKLMQEITNDDRTFGGKVFVVGGDFRQTLPVVAKGTRTDIMERCIKKSRQWRHFTQLTLTTNMRSEGQTAHNEWLLNVGMGNLPPVSGIYEHDTIQIPQHMVAKNDLISTIFENVHQMSIDDLSTRVIVAPTNAQTLEMNRKIIALMPGEPTLYYSADSAITEDPGDALNFPIEFLHDQTPSGMPPHVLLLKKGVIIMMLRNLNPKNGLCNGTRLIVESLNSKNIMARILSECNKGDMVMIPRINLAPTDTTLPFILQRRQFPVIPAYAITINKSQGQTFDHVGIDLETAVFSHGQMYVALSRSKNPKQVHVRIQPNPQQGQLLKDDRQFTKNVVFQEVFQE